MSKGRGKARATLDLIDAAVRILAEIQPATVRAVCYRLFVEKLIPNMSKASTDKVSRQLVWAREQNLLPWEWIADETRKAERVASWQNPMEIIDAARRQYRKDYWASQPRRVEVWSEKGTMRGTLAPVLQEYGITFRVLHGFGSATTLHDIADESQGEKPFTALYLGDWDPSGLYMSELDLPERLNRYAGIVSLERIALLDADVAPGTELPHFNAEDKAKDPRYEWFARNFGTRCWELDAMPPPMVRDRVATRISALLDVDAWNRAAEIEAIERESFTAAQVAFKQSISGQATKYSAGGLSA